MKARAISRIRSCSPATGPLFRSRNRETLPSFAKPPEKSRRPRQQRKPAPVSPLPKNFQLPVHPSAQSPKSLYRVSPPPPLRSSPPCRLTRSAIFLRDVRTVWETPDPPDDNQPIPRLPIRRSCAQRSPRRRIPCRHPQLLEFSPPWQ